MFGHVIFVVILGVAAALLGSFFLLDRLPTPAPVAAAPAPAGVAADPPLPAPPEAQSSGYREALLKADERGQYAGEALIDGLPVRTLLDTGATEFRLRLHGGPAGARPFGRAQTHDRDRKRPVAGDPRAPESPQSRRARQASR